MSAPAQPTPPHDTPIYVMDLHLSNIPRLLQMMLTLEGYQVDTARLYHYTTAEISAVMRTLDHMVRPTIILADPIITTVRGSELLSDYFADPARHAAHFLLLMGATPVLSRLITPFNANGLLYKPIDIDHLLRLITDAERILRDRATTPPDPFTIDS